MTSLSSQWRRFQNWLKSFLHTPEVILQSAQEEPAKKPTQGVIASFFSRPKIILTYQAGDIIKFDGRVLEGTAYVDESAIAGVSAPALISASSSQSNVLAGTLVTEGTLTVESDEPPEENPLQDSRDSRHTIRVNLAILEKEITELNRVANRTRPSAEVTAAKALLENAQGALMLEFGLSNASSEQLGEILSHVFAAMRQSTQARHLLNACVRV
jgi:hypothetical protein